MSGLIAAEWLKTRRRRMTWILFALLPIVVAVLYVMLFVAAAAAPPEDAADWDARLSLRNVVTFGDAMLYRLAALFCIILAGSMTASEFGWRTIVTFATWTGDRRRLLIAKLAVTGMLGGVLVISGWLVVVASVVIGGLARDTLRASDAGPWLAPGLLGGVAVTWVAAMVYAVIAAALATWTRSAAAAIAVPLGVLLLEPLGAASLVALGGVAEDMANLTLSFNIDALLAANGRVQGLDEDFSGYPPAWRGALFLLTFATMTAWLTLRTLARRDVRE
jgi:hypothetical protein